MSWLYTIVFAGLMFSQGNAVSNSAHSMRNEPLNPQNVLRDESEHFEQVYPLTANGRFCLSNVNGSIIVDSWDRNEVKVEYSKVADSKERLNDVEVRITAQPDYVRVETDYGDWKRDRGGWRTNNKLQVEFHITAPRGAMLNEIETVNGSVSVSNFTNYTKISAVNGNVAATNLRGTANLSTVNGEVSAEFDRLESGSKVNLNTVNGAARVVIPSDTNATFKVDSLNGNISNDFGLPVRKGKYVGRDLYGKIGTGDVVIRLSSVNGPLTISRKNDGKTPGPATNLLPQKKDDDDWGKDDDDAMVDSEMLNKDINKSVKEAEKQVARIQPEIAEVTARSIDRTAKAVEQTAKILQSEEFRQKVKDAAKVAPVVFASSVPRVEKRSESFPVKGAPKIVVEARGCSVSVKGWDKSEVQYRVVQFADARRRTPLVISEDHTESAVNIDIKNPEARDRAGVLAVNSSTARVEVYVPRRSDLKVTTDGEIRLEGVSGNVELNGGDEAVNVRDVDGALLVSTADGRIRVIGFRGDLTAKSSDGAINLEGDFRSLTAKADEGSVTLTLPDNARADLDATCPDIHGEGISIERTGTDEGMSHYRIGGGGPTYKVETAGEVRVRGSNLLVAGL
jgi:DUF4097 and DUF4098 domain-containing protein YvlB